MRYSSDNFVYGPVVVTRGLHKGQIGELDNETYERGKIYGIVYFAGFGLSGEYSIIPMSYLRLPNTNDLMSRREVLWCNLTKYGSCPLEGDARINALQELAYIDGLLGERMFEAQFRPRTGGARVFLSHSSIDKDFVISLAVDLANLSHEPWLDEWEILGGESIPTRIADGLNESDFVLVVLSKDSVESPWVENEWQAKYWEEVSSKRVSVVPVLRTDCVIPTLLKTKKYIDFRHDYERGLEALALTLKKHLEKREK